MQSSAAYLLGIVRRLHASSTAFNQAISGSSRPGLPASTLVTGTASPSSRSSGPPFLSWLPGARSQLIGTSLSQPLPGIIIPPAFRAHSSPPPTEFTTLPNGVRIISETASGPTASIGIFADSGSIHETSQQTGTTAMLECMGFKSTHNRSAQSIMKEVEHLGATFIASGSREQTSYSMDCLKTCVAPCLEILCDAVLNPAFLPHEVDECKARVAAVTQSPGPMTVWLSEQLIQNAFAGALGKPLLPGLDELSRITPDSLREFCAVNYAAPRLILVASGVDHKTLVDLATPMLSTAPAAPNAVPDQPSSSYKGGFVSLPGEGPLGQMIVGWEYKGGWLDVKGAVAAVVWTYLMGGGDSFSSGGPGKGMHSRLYTRVLNHYSWVHSCSVFNATFNNSGLVGIQGSFEPSHAREMLDVLCGEMEAAARALKGVEVDRAKRATLAFVSQALESKAISAEDIGRQHLTYGKRITGREYEDIIEAVTPRDIEQFVSGLLESKPSLALQGPGVAAVSYDNLLRRYGKGPASTASSWPVASKPNDSTNNLKKIFSFGSRWRSS